MKFWLQFIWLLPATLISWILYILPLWACGYIRYYGRVRHLTDSKYKSSVPVFRLARRNGSFAKLWEGWAGHSVPMAIIFHHDLLTKDRIDELPIIIHHEAVHNTQHLRWGIFFYPVYFLMSVWIYLFVKDKHPYIDNPFEVEARRISGEKVHIPEKQWKDYGMKKRWPWW